LGVVKGGPPLTHFPPSCSLYIILYFSVPAPYPSSRVGNNLAKSGDLQMQDNLVLADQPTPGYQACQTFTMSFGGSTHHWAFSLAFVYHQTQQ